MDCRTDRDEDAIGGTKPETDDVDTPSSSTGRLRRRLCRNCDKDLSSPSEAALPAGVNTNHFWLYYFILTYIVYNSNCYGCMCFVYTPDTINGSLA